MVGPTSSTRIVQEEVGANLAAKRALASGSSGLAHQIPLQPVSRATCVSLGAEGL